jgi:hypothetical protein
MFKAREAPHMLILETYLAYLLISIPVTVWVARTLHRNGRIFLVDAFHGQDALADSVNHLLVVGFYLVNLGWIVMTLQTRDLVSTPQSAIELLSTKIGTVLFVLGLMHFFNLYLFNRFRRRALDLLAWAPPPVPPTDRVAPPAEPAR